MELNEYKLLIEERFNKLNDDEKDSIRAIIGTSAARSLTKIFGPEMQHAIKLGPIKNPKIKKRGLGTR